MAGALHPCGDDALISVKITKRKIFADRKIAIPHIARDGERAFA